MLEKHQAEQDQTYPGPLQPVAEPLEQPERLHRLLVTARPPGPHPEPVVVGIVGAHQPLTEAQIQQLVLPREVQSGDRLHLDLPRSREQLRK